jgi:hypothetical protein
MGTPHRPPSATVSYGIAFECEDAGRLTEKVLNLALICAALNILNAIFLFLSNISFRGAVGALITLLFGLLFPFCGYKGAQENNRHLLCMVSFTQSP